MGDSLDEAIREIIAQAVRTDELLRVAEVSSQLARSYPNSGYSTDAIAEMIIQAGVSARIPLEIDTRYTDRGAAARRSATP